MSITVTLRTATEEVNVTDWVASAVWGGSYNQMARTLNLTVLAAPWGGQTPPECPLGAEIEFAENGETKFVGIVKERQMDTSGTTKDLYCVDYGHYLKSEFSGKYTSITPEGLVGKLCDKFGITKGSVAATGQRFSRVFSATSIYKAIMTGYSLAPRTDESRYLVRFMGQRLCVVEKTQGTDTLIIQPGSNLVSAKVKESMPTVTAVEIQDKNGNKVGAVEDAALKKTYGLLQSVIKQSKNKNAQKEAKAALADGGEGQTITITYTGEEKPIAGDCVILVEPISGTRGLFWVDSDSYTWAKDGLVTGKLTLNFRNIMDDASAGSES